MKSVIFDIETEGLDAEWQLKTFEPKFKLDGRIKDAAKLEVDRREKEQEWLDEAALDAKRSRVLVIGVCSDDGSASYILEGSEADLLSRFWKCWTDNVSAKFIGHNIKGFDVPFMLRRSFVNGIIPPPDIVDGRYLNRRFIDTMELWGAGEWGAKISLDNLARALGVGKKSESGRDFAARYHTEKEKALLYVKHDLDLTLQCAKKMGVI